MVIVLFIRYNRGEVFAKIPLFATKEQMNYRAANARTIIFNELM